METYIKTKDYFLTGEQFQLKYKVDLDMLITTPQPENLHKYYQSDSYISHTDANETILDKVYSYVKKYTTRRKIRLLESLGTSSKTILDIGAGTGEFLKVISKKGWTTQGIEPNTSARTIAKSKGVHLKNSITEITTKTDIITLWHVLEHLPDLDNQIKGFTRQLKNSGFLIIAVPNYKSYDANKYKSHWAAYDVPRHLWHFSQKSITKIFKPYGYTLTQTVPMCFDSFYVSILSEKYKHGHPNYFRAFFTGLVSNISAFFSGEYSSIIYVLQKR